MRTWILAAAVGTALSVSVVDSGFAQAASTRSRASQNEAARDQARRDAERDRLRATRTSSTQADRQRAEQERARAEQVRRAQDSRAARTVQDNRARAAEAARELERERLRREREQYDARYGRSNDRYNDRYDDRYDRNDRWRDSDGPSFCRSGAGHPVHGRQWCRDKGFGLGRDQWSRDSWGDIFTGSRRDRRYDRYDQTFSRSVLADLLGAVMLNRFESYGRQYGTGATTGRWMLDGGATVLQLYIGSVPIARLVDGNRDGRVDNVFLRN